MKQSLQSIPFERETRSFECRKLDYCTFISHQSISTLRLIMAGQNYTVEHCSDESWSMFDKSITHKLWLVNALQLAGAILGGVIVGVAVFGNRYRYHRFTRFIFVGATTLFLPVMSTVVPLAAGPNDFVQVWQRGIRGQLAAKCDAAFQTFTVVIWASVVQIIMINTSAIVAVDDREGRNIGPPFELLVQGIWMFYLGITYMINSNSVRIKGLTGFVLAIGIFEGIPFTLTCGKIVFKYYAFEKARQSFALGKNPHLIFAYMQQPQLQATSHHREAAVVTDEDAPPPPPLLVMGEEKRHMEKQSHGYVWKGDSGTALHRKDGLVTIDSVWTMKGFFPLPTLQPLQDLCLSFALFKLLRCRFARYSVNNTANASSDIFKFFWSLLLKEGSHNRVFQVISDEISFCHDYYYSSIPISYSKCWLPILSIFISLLSISYYIFAATLFSIILIGFYTRGDLDGEEIPQFVCKVMCILDDTGTQNTYGSWWFGIVPLFFLLVLVLIVEVRDMASYICSNWTKVALVCRLLTHASSSSKHSLCIQKCAGLLLRCRCKLLRRHWDEKIGQCSVLVLQPRATPLGILWQLFPFLPDLNRKVRVPAAVKVCIIEALRKTRCDGGQLSNGASCLRRRQGQVGESFLWACSNKSTSYTILTWHIATSILEVRYPHLHDEEQGSPPLSNTDYKMVATYLSRYCAYLVTWCPELLPDDHEWSSSLYENVKKDARLVLGGFTFTAGDSLTPEAKCQQLVELLRTKAKHQVVKEGAKLGKQLSELVLEGGDDTAWKLLAEFWSDMILYVAPSNNLKGHKEAIARGGELITLLWVLLFHAGIVSRPDEVDQNAATSAAGVV